MRIGNYLPAPVKQLARRSLGRIQHLNAFYQKVFAERLRKDFSQAGETVAVRRLTKKRYGGVFVEIGANDGVRLSTTLGLIKSGWSGWSIEANPATYVQLVANLRGYSRVKLMNVAVAPTRGKVPLFLGKNDPEGFYATLSLEDSDWFRQHRSEVVVEVDGIPLDELLSEEKVPKHFDLLMVDTEGMDLEILRTFNPVTHRPYLIVTEDYEPKNEEKFDLLRSFGYRLDCRIGCNTFWADTR